MAKTAFLWLALATAPAAASPPYAPLDDRPLSANYHRCTVEDPSTAGLGRCAEVELQRQEERLNRTYRQVMARLGPERRTALRTAERAWVEDRRRACDRVYRFMEGGTGDGLALDTCLSLRALRRIAWLARYR